MVAHLHARAAGPSSAPHAPKVTTTDDEATNNSATDVSTSLVAEAHARRKALSKLSKASKGTTPMLSSPKVTPSNDTATSKITTADSIPYKIPTKKRKLNIKARVQTPNPSSARFGRRRQAARGNDVDENVPLTAQHEEASQEDHHKYKMHPNPQPERKRQTHLDEADFLPPVQSISASDMQQARKRFGPEHAERLSLIRKEVERLPVGGPFTMASKEKRLKKLETIEREAEAAWGYQQARELGE